MSKIVGKSTEVSCTHSVYVVELDRRVWTESAKIRKANPQYRGKLGCLYVGMTSHDPKLRFEYHKSGHRNKKGIKVSSSIVERYGLYLRPSLYAHLNPMIRARAAYIERALAGRLKRQGYAVWWN